MTDHLSPTMLNAVADGEFSADQLATANEHLAGCSSCTASALQQSLLKSATARAGQRYTMPPRAGEAFGIPGRDAGHRAFQVGNLVTGMDHRGGASSCLQQHDAFAAPHAQSGDCFR